MAIVGSFYREPEQVHAFSRNQRYPDLQRNGGNWPNIGVILIGITITDGLVDYFSARLRARLT